MTRKRYSPDPKQISIDLIYWELADNHLLHTSSANFQALTLFLEVKEPMTVKYF